MRVLIIEKENAVRYALIDAAQATGGRFSFESAATSAEALERVGTAEFSVCVIGPTMGTAEQERMLLALRNRPELSACLIIVALGEADALLSNSFVASGASAVVIEPHAEAALRKVFERAALSLQAPGEPEGSEQITSLPWILQSLASRLRTLGERLESESAEGESLEGSPKLVKEALLGAIGSNDSEQLVQEILKSARAAREGQERK